MLRLGLGEAKVRVQASDTMRERSVGLAQVPGQERRPTEQVEGCGRDRM